MSKVRVVDAVCPECGPRYRGTTVLGIENKLGYVVDAERLRTQKQVCECGQPVLLSVEPFAPEADDAN